MRIVCISDTHGLHTIMDDINPLPKGDVLIHAGDCTNVGKPQQVKDFVEWFMNIKGFDSKIFIAGNHDFAFEKRHEPHHKGDFDWYYHLMNEENLSQSDVVYLEDGGFTIDSSEFSRPIKFWGSPWQPEFYNWAFNLPRLGEDLKKYWDMIPDDTDVLITHGPPNEVRDFVNNWRQPVRNVGCELLRFRVEQVKPLLHIFGHIHEAYGVEYNNNILYVNASTCTEGYRPTNKPIIIDLIEVDGIITANFIDE
jgi:Icc-related predicted phosphoesterase